MARRAKSQRGAEQRGGERGVESRLLHLLQANRRWRDPELEPRNLSPWLLPLQRWQAARLTESFADFSAAPDTAAATDFFLSDLYGDHDVSARDRGVEKVMPMMRRLLPDELLHTVADAIELAVLSHAFDLRVAQALETLLPTDAELDAATYGKAYRMAGLPRLRHRQIALIATIGMALDAAVRKPWLARVLRMSRLPARAAGLLDLQSFLERGFAAFAGMQDAQGFMQEIARREGEVSRRLFAADPQPFRRVRKSRAAQANSRSR
ncbi:hypothetical protein [Denitratimonas sp. CY0512]|uniref:FFLEELY motif protein n=1 Tax=Denitratimonas sp. CY0512 TaxID=3131940 RepID=UPI0030978723